MSTVWKETAYPGYVVSDEGEVRGPTGRVLRPGPVGKRKEYRQVSCGRRRSVRVHVLVAEAFLGPRPEGHHVAHLNGNAADNRAANLAYKTPKENAADKVIHGTNRTGWVPGEKNGRAVLTADQVREIRALPEGFNRSRVARQYGISRRQMLDIVNGKTWRSIL